MPRTVKLVMLCALWVFGPAWPSCALALNQIKGIRHWVAPDHTRVVIDISDEVRYTVEKGDRHLAIDLEETAFPAGLPDMVVLNKPGVEAIALLPRSDSGVRVDLTFPEMVQTTVFKLKKFLDKPDRIVIDIVLPDRARQESEAREQVKTARKERIIVIDPGHGGEAVGAVGKGGTYEKDVVLAIGRKLLRVINSSPGYRAFLTRDGDYYVSFRKRLMIAREYGADMFVSIHADAARRRSASGSSVYCLSTRGASSAAAQILAQNENLADTVGGVPAGEGGEASDPVILDMIQTHAINQSRTFGGTLLHHLEGVNRLKFATVQEAPFRVLKLPDIPSVLVETAYISNSKEEKLLRSDRFQNRIAESIARSIVAFLPSLSPPVLLAADQKPGKAGQGEGKARETGDVAGKKGGKGKPGENAAGAPAGRLAEEMSVQPLPADERIVIHRVRKGETLQVIARRYGTSVATLLVLNRMKLQDPLYVNRNLKITTKADEGTADRKKVTGVKRLPSAQKAEQVAYRVKRGDTLSTIARRHGTTVSAICALNRMKPDAPLVVHRTLILPAGAG